MAGEPNHLSPAVLTVANLPWLERLAHMHGRWWIAQPHAEAASARLYAAFQFGPGRHAPPPDRKAGRQAGAARGAQRRPA